MSTTINISLPKSLLREAKKIVSKRGYASVSELFRHVLRTEVYREQGLTENGFTPEFEEGVLRAEKEMDEGIYETWDGKTDFTEFVLSHSPKKKQS